MYQQYSDNMHTLYSGQNQHCPSGHCNFIVHTEQSAGARNKVITKQDIIYKSERERRGKREREDGGEREGEREREKKGRGIMWRREGARNKVITK